jgi:acyl-coenzyme A thioesterase PaaI-like protein
MAVPQSMSKMPWIVWLDMTTEFAANGEAVTRLERPKPEHLNHNGAINAAVAYGVAEVAGGSAVTKALGDQAYASYVALKNGRIEYRAPAHDGLHASALLPADVAEAAREALRQDGRADVHVEVQMSDAHGRHTGVCTFDFALRRRRSG